MNTTNSAARQEREREHSIAQTLQKAGYDPFMANATAELVQEGEISLDQALLPQGKQKKP